MRVPTMAVPQRRGRATLRTGHSTRGAARPAVDLRGAARRARTSVRAHAAAVRSRAAVRAAPRARQASGALPALARPGKAQESGAVREPGAARPTGRARPTGAGLPAARRLRARATEARRWTTRPDPGDAGRTSGTHGGSRRARAVPHRGPRPRTARRGRPRPASRRSRTAPRRTAPPATTWTAPPATTWTELPAAARRGPNAAAPGAAARRVPVPRPRDRRGCPGRRTGSWVPRRRHPGRARHPPSEPGGGRRSSPGPRWRPGRARRVHVPSAGPCQDGRSRLHPVLLRVVVGTAYQPAQPGQPVGDGPLRTVRGRPVVVLPDHVVRRVLLGYHAARVVVRVPVPGPVSQPLRAGVVRVAQMPGYRSGLAGPHVLHRCGGPHG